MAIIACPACGKKVTDRMVTCPHCQAVLIRQPESKPATREEIKASVKERIVGVSTTTVFTMIIARIWWFLASIYAGRLMGDVALAAIGCASVAFYISTFVLLIIEALIFCVQPKFLADLKLSRILLTVIVSVLFVVLGRFAQHHATLLLTRNHDILAYTQSIDLAFGAAFPLLWSSLLIATYSRNFKKALGVQGILAAVFLVASTILEVLMIVALQLGAKGFSIANLVSAALALSIALFTSKEFQRFIAPK